jgi:hypothetical protein
MTISFAWAAPIAIAGLAMISVTVRLWIKSFVEGRVKFGLDKQMESIRNQLRESEERLKSDLRQKEAEIASLRDGALSGRAARASLIDRRRIEAADKIWAAVIKLGGLQGPALTLSMLKFDEVARRVADDRDLREMLEEMMLVKNFEETISQIEADKERPYVNDILWSTYAAYSSIIVGSWAIMKMLTTGIRDADKFLKIDYMKNVLKAALPHRSSFIDGSDVTSHYHLLDELKQNILSQVKNELDGRQADQESIERAAQIMDAVKRFERDANEVKRPTAASDIDM